MNDSKGLWSRLGAAALLALGVVGTGCNFEARKVAQTPAAALNAAGVETTPAKTKATASKRRSPRTFEVTFPSRGRKLYGYITKPNGAGPFPTFIWNHGSERKGSHAAKLADFFVSQGYVFFVPIRTGHGKSPGTYFKDNKSSGTQIHDMHANDVSDAIRYAKSLSYVDKDRLALGGCSFGGIQSLIAAERGQGLRAVVDWAGGAMSWSNTSLQQRLFKAVDHAKVPIFFLQAQNDYSTGPTKTLSARAKRQGKDVRSKIYPAYGTSKKDGHGGFCMRQTKVWEDDVMAFLKKHGM